MLYQIIKLVNHLMTSCLYMLSTPCLSYKAVPGMRPQKPKLRTCITACVTINIPLAQRPAAPSQNFAALRWL